MKHVDFSQGQQVTLFNSIGIEVASKCNRHCYFCPNDYFDRPDLFMPMGTIEKMLDELAALKYSGRVEWYIYNEPTRDKRLPEIISLCRQKLPRACQMINTNGDYFSKPDHILDLFRRGLNQMQINIYSSTDDHQDDATFHNGVRLARERQGKLQGWINGMPEINQWLSLYQNIGPKKWAAKVVPKFGIRKTVKNTEVAGPNYFSNRSGNVPGFRDANSEPLAKHCTIPFRFLNINYLGDCILCCNDFKGETNFGNVNSNTLVEIWNHPTLNLYRLKLQHKNRMCFLCDKCDYAGGFYPHMTDKVTYGDNAADLAVIEADLRAATYLFEQKN